MALYKDDRHIFYWIENGVLYETYATIRGRRYRDLACVNYPDREKVEESELEKVEKSIIPGPF